MAQFRFLIASFLLLLFAVSLVEPRPVLDSQMLISGGVERSLLNTTPMNCGEACTARCRLASRQKMCLRACGTCCSRCSCVPPGTAGNEDVCPCYATMTTHGGRHKCP